MQIVLVKQMEGKMLKVEATRLYNWKLGIEVKECVFLQQVQWEYYRAHVSKRYGLI